jgi:hypothetical protein
MTKDRFKLRSLGAGGLTAVLLAGLLAGPAVAKTTTIQQPAVDTSACVNPQLSQPFLSTNDTNWYMLAPGQTPAGFNGGGWTLSGGAQITAAQLADGQTGSALDLPSGSEAVSPVMCVTADYPTARVMARGATAGGITFSVSYAGTKTADNAKKTGKIQTKGAGWSLSDPFSTNPGILAGWQLVQFTFSSKQAHAQLYDFYVDPRMRG